jgi:homoserine dehydrogenase
MVNIGIIGLGTVGCSTFKVLTLNKELLQDRLGCPIKVKKVCAKNPDKDRGLDLSGVEFTTSIDSIINDKDIDIVVELMGGLTTAKELTLAAFKAGKHIVTANKDLIARNGNEIIQAAIDQKCAIQFEAAVGGGIPIIKSILDGLSGNEIEWVAGIINGTANFILTKMVQDGWSFEKSLKKAQDLGYAEADPTYDVGGIDAAHKIAILASVSFGIPFQFNKVYCESLENIELLDVKFAKELGFTFKQISLARMTKNGVECRVHPALISNKSLLSSVNGVMNAVVVNANAVGPTMYYGAGAGGFATASSVVADIVEIAKMVRLHTEGLSPFFAHQPMKKHIQLLDEGEFNSSFYLRLNVRDEAGTLAKITQIFANNSISIESLLQKPCKENLIPICIVTHNVPKKQLNAAISQIRQLSAVEQNLKTFHIVDIDIGE